MIFTRTRRRSQLLDRAHRLYQGVVTQAREQAFYRDCGVPDTLDGRFDMIVLHAILVLRRLKREGGEGSELGQELFDVLFGDMEQSLREMGVGDLSVGRRVKAMAQAFYGRAAAYEAALANDDAALADALRRNLFGTVEPDARELDAVAGYVRRQAAALDAQPGDDMLAGDIRFVDPPGCGERGM